MFLLGPLAVVFLSSLSRAEYVSFPPVGLSMRWYAAMFSNSEFVDSLLVSLRIATVVAILSGVTGVLAALAMTRIEFRGRFLLNALFLSPLVVPGIVLGAAILQFYARSGMTSSTTSLILAHLAIATPYTIRLTTASLVGFDTRLELRRAIWAPRRSPPSGASRCRSSCPESLRASRSLSSCRSRT